MLKILLKPDFHTHDKVNQFPLFVPDFPLIYPFPTYFQHTCSNAI